MPAISTELLGEVHDTLLSLTLLVLVPLMIWAMLDLERRKERWQSGRHAARVRRRGSQNL
jgi:hypothetical protein